MSGDLQVYVMLRKLMTERLSDDELNVLCFDIGLDYDDLGGDSKAEKVIELLQDIRRREQLARLIEVGKASRPDIEWEATIAVGEPIAAAGPARASFAPTVPPASEAPDEELTPKERNEAFARDLLAELLPFLNGDTVLSHHAIGEKKLSTVVENYRIPRGERVLVLVDRTVFRSGKHGIAFGLRGLYYNNDWMDRNAGPDSLSYDELIQRSPKVNGEYELELGQDQVINIAGAMISPKDLAKMIRAVKKILVKE